MSIKKQDKISLLASLRRQATESELVATPREQPAQVVALPAPPTPVLLSDPAPFAPTNGSWLERTSITLKTPDREALKALTLFLMHEGQQHVQTSTVIQAALQYSAAHLEGGNGEFLAAFEGVRRADRRKIT